MSVKVASLYAEIGADVSKFQAGAKTVKSDLGSLSSNFSSVLPPMLTQFLGVAGAATALGTALKFSVDQAAEAQLVDAKLNAVLQSTGGAAGMSAKELDNLATSLSHVSTYDDEAVKSSEALLLTFTNIGRNVFPEAEKAILDMSAALGQDLQSSTIQLGKALNDPIQGITALRRVGVSFTEDQQKMIKALVETGDTLGAQKVILAELSKEFGGQAAAAANTYTGQITQLKNEIANLGEAVGNDLLPQLTEETKALKDSVIWITQNYEAIKNLEYWSIRLTNPLMFIGDIMGGIDKNVRQLTLSLAGLIGKEEGVAKIFAAQDSQITGLVDSLKSLVGIKDKTREATNKQAQAITGNLIPAMVDEKEIAKELSNTLESHISLIDKMQSAEEDYTQKSADLAQNRADAEQKLADLQEETDVRKTDAYQEALEKLQKAEDRINKLRAKGIDEHKKVYRDAIKDIIDAQNNLADVEQKNADAHSEEMQAALDDVAKAKQAEEDLAKERERQSLQFVSQILAENLARDGWTQSEFDAFAKQQEAWGLWSADVVQKAQAAWMEADKITDSIHAIPDKTTKEVEILVSTSVIDRGPNSGAADKGFGPGSGASGSSDMASSGSGGSTSTSFWDQPWNQGATTGSIGGGSGLFDVGFAGLDAGQQQVLQNALSNYHAIGNAPTQTASNNAPIDYNQLSSSVATALRDMLQNSGVIR